MKINLIWTKQRNYTFQSTLHGFSFLLQGNNCTFQFSNLLLAFSCSHFIPLPLTNKYPILFASLSLTAFKEFSINSLTRESTNCFTLSFFHSHSLISLPKICSFHSSSASFVLTRRHCICYEIGQQI